MVTVHTLRADLHYKGPFRPGPKSPPGDGSLHGGLASIHVTAVWELVDVDSADGNSVGLQISCPKERKVDFASCCCTNRSIEVTFVAGGFACLPGSHRPDYRWPEKYPLESSEEWREPVGGEWPEDLGMRRSPQYFCMHVVLHLHLRAYKSLKTPACVIRCAKGRG
eukprot:COSAG02_NODE_10207_length_1995_cov_1.816456_2_plen_166_part_00